MKKDYIEPHMEIERFGSICCDDDEIIIASGWGMGEGGDFGVTIGGGDS